MGNLKIQSGNLKGRNIPAVEINDKSNFTPALLKKAVFSMLISALEDTGTNPTNVMFIDSFGGSGQMGFEAASIGLGIIHILELDPARFQAMRKFAEFIQDKSASRIMLHRKDTFRFFPEEEYAKLIVFFLDPPYSFWNAKGKEKIIRYVNALQNKINTKLVIFIQSQEAILPGLESRKYGNHYIHIYKSWQ